MILIRMLLTTASTDDIFAKIVALYPHCGSIYWNDYFHPGKPDVSEKKSCIWVISQISGGSRTSVGGYVEPEPEEENSAQFDVSDNADVGRSGKLADAYGVYSKFLYRMLSGRQDRRPVYESV